MEIEVRNAEKQRNGGFTLIEILIAVVILALAVTTVSGLQSAALSGTRQSAHRVQALLIVRQIFALYDSVEPDIAEFSYEGTPSQVMQKLSQLDSPPGSLSDVDSPYFVNVSLTPWSVENLPPGALWRLLVTVRWSNDPRDSLEVPYFVTQQEEDPQ
jgi:prepilin-type N-terminal cleavage/methylation domain-containing protein